MNTIRNRRMSDWQRSPLQRLADEAREAVMAMRDKLAALWAELRRTIRNDPHLLRDAHRAAWLMVILVGAVVLPMQVPRLMGLGL